MNKLRTEIQQQSSQEQDLSFQQQLQFSRKQKRFCTHKRLLLIAAFTVFIAIALIIIFSFPQEIHITPQKPSIPQNQSYLYKQSHDKKCYTQGLFFINNTHLMQSCGGRMNLYGPSYFRVLSFYNQTLFEVFRSPTFAPQVFLQGSTLFPKNNLIYILTWQENIVYRVNPVSLETIDILSWTREGWGLTHNHSHLILSDGSAVLFVLNEHMQILEQVVVLREGRAIRAINELQWVSEQGGQFVYANVYGWSTILKIDWNNQKGKVVDQKNYQYLADAERRQGVREVFNGIAYHESSKKFILTGKLWNYFYAY